VCACVCVCLHAASGKYKNKDVFVICCICVLLLTVLGGIAKAYCGRYYRSMVCMCVSSVTLMHPAKAVVQNEMPCCPKYHCIRPGSQETGEDLGVRIPSLPRCHISPLLWPLFFSGKLCGAVFHYSIIFCVFAIFITTSLYILLHHLRWLPIWQQVTFMLAMMTFKCLHNLALSYVPDMYSRLVCRR